MHVHNMTTENLIALFEKVFHDFKENIYESALNCRNNDASTALYEVHGAICMMDIPSMVREAMKED